MGSAEFDRKAKQVASRLGGGRRLAILGSSSLSHPESEATCIALGGALARIRDLVLLTGGVPGVGETVGRSFLRASRSARGRVVHLLPRGWRRWDYGQTFFAGSTMRERREILGRLARIYVTIEGGPGTAHEARVALAHGALLLPVGRSGGHSAELHRRLPRPPGVGEAAWDALARPEVSLVRAVDAIAEAVCELGARSDASEAAAPDPEAPMEDAGYPQSPEEWRAVIEDGLGWSASRARAAFDRGSFPFDRLEASLRSAFLPETHGPAFIAALRRNLRGLVAWAYGAAGEPYWPGSDDSSSPGRGGA